MDLTVERIANRDDGEGIKTWLIDDRRFQYFQGSENKIK